MPDPELRESLKRANKQAILPKYDALYEKAAGTAFTKNPDKYLKFTPIQASYIHTPTQTHNFLRELRNSRPQFSNNQDEKIKINLN